MKSSRFRKQIMLSFLLRYVTRSYGFADMTFNIYKNNFLLFTEMFSAAFELLFHVVCLNMFMLKMLLTSPHILI